MSDPTGSGGASFIEGLTSGFGGGFQLREGIKERKRKAQLAADLLTLRQQENARREQHEQFQEGIQTAEEGRKATTFGEQQAEYSRVQGIRRGVGAYLKQPERFGTLGQYVSGQA